MAKQKKKRNKRYTGAGAAQGPVVHHYEAVERGKLGDWWVDNKMRIRIIGIIAAAAGVIALVVSGFVTLAK